MRRTTALIASLTAAVAVLSHAAIAAPPAKKPAPKPTPAPRLPQFPRDAGPHDFSNLEWWYVYSFLTTESGKKYAVVTSFFRTGLSTTKKGHYLIYSLADLDEKQHSAYSILDKTNVNLLQSALPLLMATRPNDDKLFELAAYLRRGTLPAPHQKLGVDAVVRKKPRFSISMETNTLSQESDDGRTWHTTLGGDDWQASLDLTQPTRPALLPGGGGQMRAVQNNGLYYLTLSRMDVTGTLTIDGEIENVTGSGWLDRQWGSPGFIASYGWDWFGVQMDDGSDILMFRIRNLATGKVVRVEATTLTKDGRQIVETPTLYKPSGAYKDDLTGITFPAGFDVSLPKAGYVLNLRPAFAEQTIPVVGVGEAIWEGVVNVTGTAGTSANRTPATGRGYMELFGYRARPVKK